jgi:hypothetical protein
MDWLKRLIGITPEHSLTEEEKNKIADNIKAKLSRMRPDDYRGVAGLLYSRWLIKRGRNHEGVKDEY